MISGTLYFSKAVMALLEADDRKLLTDRLDELIEKQTGRKATVGIAGSISSNVEVCVQLTDVNNISGVKSDWLAAKVKLLISGFFLAKKYMINPLKVTVMTNGTNVV